MPHAFIIGGSGQIGIAAGTLLADIGWNVTLASRTAPPDGPWRHRRLDREAPGALTAAFGQGADLMLDCVAFDEGHAAQLAEISGDVGRIVAVSSASVYVDPQGRTLDEARETGFPEFPVPITEKHPILTPGPATYSTRKVAMEQHLRAHSRAPVTILRPCAIHGPHSKHAREWWVVKRLLDGRRRIPLAYGGRSRFQTTSVRAIAQAVLAAHEGRAAEVVNVVDGDAPSVAEIVRAVIGAMGREAELVLLDDKGFPPSNGQTPWSIYRDMICATSLPPAGTYAETVAPAIDWLCKACADRPWQEVIPQLAAYPRDHFDYAAEDAALGD